MSGEHVLLLTFPAAHLKTSRTCAIDLFCKNSESLKTVICFAEKLHCRCSIVLQIRLCLPIKGPPLLLKPFEVVKYFMWSRDINQPECYLLHHFFKVNNGSIKTMSQTYSKLIAKKKSYWLQFYANKLGWD